MCSFLIPISASNALKENNFSEVFKNYLNSATETLSDIYVKSL